MNKIRFYTSTKSELKDSLLTIRDGLQMFGKVLWRLFDTGAHSFPYAYMFFIIIVGCIFSITAIMQARSERDAAIKKTYMVQQELDSLKVFNDIKNGGTYVQYED